MTDDEFKEYLLRASKVEIFYEELNTDMIYQIPALTVQSIPSVP